jgi:hypothetical protein
MLPPERLYCQHPQWRCCGCRGCPVHQHHCSRSVHERSLEAIAVEPEICHAHHSVRPVQWPRRLKTRIGALTHHLFPANSAMHSIKTNKQINLKLNLARARSCHFFYLSQVRRVHYDGLRYTDNGLGGLLSTMQGNATTHAVADVRFTNVFVNGKLVRCASVSIQMSLSLRSTCCCCLFVSAGKLARNWCVCSKNCTPKPKRQPCCSYHRRIHSHLYGDIRTAPAAA